MREKKAIWKKTMSVVLSLAMAAGLSPVAGKPLTVEAAGNDGPPIEFFATQEDLMNNEYNLTGSGIERMVEFGKGGSDGEQSRMWYIAGYDRYADNLVLICDPSSPIFLSDMTFSYKYPDPRFPVTESQGLKIDTCTYKDQLPTEVGMSHYGLSKIRTELKDIEQDAEVFSDAEQKLMKNTTIFTYDRCNEEYYSTTDKLYLPQAPDTGIGTYAIVGQNSDRYPDRGLKIELKSSSSSSASWVFYSNNFWTRTPPKDNNNKVVYFKSAYNSYFNYSDAYGGYYTSQNKVVPAFALDLSSVLFASIIEKEKEDVSEYTGAGSMTFRLDDSMYNKIASTVEYTETGVKITKNRDASALYLCAQGKDDSGNNWHYSKRIRETQDIDFDSIWTGANASNSKIWIETTQENVTYAKMVGNVAAPTASVASGTYTTNQSVTLKTTTPGASIYYTTDGSVPDEENGIKYDGPISIKGKQRESVTVTVKARTILDSDHSQKSPVRTFRYVINLPHAHSWSTSWKSDGSAHWHECSAGSCTVTANNQKNGYAAHIADNGTVTVQPAAGKTGVKTYKCSVCGYVMRQETIPATGGGTAPVDKDKVSDELDVPKDTAGKIQTVAKDLKVPTDTLLITDKTVTSQKSDNEIKGSSFAKIQAKASKTTSKSVKLSWNKVKGADGYLVYGNRCNSGGKKYPYKLIKTVNKGSTKSYTQSKLKKGTFYKYMVCAYKLVDGKKITIAASKTIHVTTSGGKYGNAKSLKLNKTKVTLKKGKTFKIKAKEIKQSKKLKKHRSICYESSNTKVATVSKKGVIKAKAKGSCTVYVYAQNGMYKAVKVTVK